MVDKSLQHITVSSLGLGLKSRPKPSFMRLKIRRLLGSFIPVSELQNNRKARSIQ